MQLSSQHPSIIRTSTAEASHTAPNNGARCRSTSSPVNKHSRYSSIYTHPRQNKRKGKTDKENPLFGVKNPPGEALLQEAADTRAGTVRTAVISRWCLRPRDLVCRSAWRHAQRHCPGESGSCARAPAAAARLRDVEREREKEGGLVYWEKFPAKFGAFAVLCLSHSIYPREIASSEITYLRAWCTASRRLRRRRRRYERREGAPFRSLMVWERARERESIVSLVGACIISRTSAVVSCAGPRADVCMFEQARARERHREKRMGSLGASWEIFHGRALAAIRCREFWMRVLGYKRCTRVRARGEYLARRKGRLLLPRVEPSVVDFRQYRYFLLQ